jgi:osmoprotectant transport system permease protein
LAFRARLLIVSALVLFAPAAGQAERPEVVVGSKKFTESVVLGEIVRGLAEAGGAAAVHRGELGGSRILFNALRRGDLDVYPEYSGTIRLELLADLGLRSDRQLPAALEELGVRMSAPLGFNNTYAIGVLRHTAESLGLRTIGDLAGHPELSLAFTNEFLDRADGWPGLKAAYGLPHAVRGIDHDLAYRALEAGEIAATDLYSTDAEIAYYDLAILGDDRGYFPRYDAVLLYRADLETRAPGALASMLRLEGSLDESRMSSLNEAVKIGVAPDGGGEPVRWTEPRAASVFIQDAFGETVKAESDGLRARLLRTTAEQAWLVGVSLLLAVAAGVPLGIVAARFSRVSPLVLGTVGILQTIPALALLVVLIKPFGLTATTAIVALFLYSLLPIVRNTHAGIAGIPGDLIESAEALGMSGWARLTRVELPLALPTVLAGVKTAAVINIGTATLAALIGAGGYGQPILTGIRLDDFGLILEGALPAAGMAVAAQLLFDGVERLVVSPGIRGR